MSLFKTWNQWSQDPNLQNTFISHDSINEHIDLIQESLRQKRTDLRVIGPSGIGKTRLVFEALRPPDPGGGDELQNFIAASVIYADVGGSQGFSDQIIGSVKALVDEKRRAIVVIDNCSLGLQSKLLSEIRRSDSSISLITIHFDLETSGDADRVITLDPIKEESTIRNIIKDVSPKLTDQIVERAVEFAEGFPQIAVMLGQSWKKDPESGGVINDPEMIRRLLGKTADDPNELRIAQSCSMFRAFGVSGGC